MKNKTKLEKKQNPCSHVLGISVDTGHISMHYSFLSLPSVSGLSPLGGGCCDYSCMHSSSQTSRQTERPVYFKFKGERNKLIPQCTEHLHITFSIFHLINFLN